MLTVKRIPTTSAVFFLSSFFLSKTKSPKPAPEESPAITEPKLKTPCKYIIVKRTDTAQFGINPKIPAMTGCKIEFWSITASIFSGVKISKA